MSKTLLQLLAVNESSSVRVEFPTERYVHVFVESMFTNLIITDKSVEVTMLIRYIIFCVLLLLWLCRAKKAPIKVGRGDDFDNDQPKAPDCPKLFSYHDGKAYWTCTQTLKYNKAQAMCNHWGGHLAEPYNMKELNHILDNYAKHPSAKEGILIGFQKESNGLVLTQ